MNVAFNDLSRAAAAQGRDLKRVVESVMVSGWFVHGPNNQAFEDELSTYLGVDHVLGVASGTDALELAFRAVSSAARPVIVTVANAGMYAACAALAAGLELRFCDVDPVTHTLDPSSLEQLLDERTAAVVVTHLYGRVADVEAVNSLCVPRGISVIEDCAQSLGAASATGMAGSIGDVATFSFYPTKNLGALGDGGAVATRHGHLAQKLVALRQYGWIGKYRNAVPGGRNSRLDELQAAILRYRLGLLEDGNRRRRDIIKRYAQAAPPSVRVLPAGDIGHSGHLAVVEVEDAERLRLHLHARGIATEVHYPVPDHRQEVLAGHNASMVELPVTERLAGRICTLPCFPEMTADEVELVCESLRSFPDGGAT